MKAVVLTAYGDVDKLELRDVPEPTPGRGEILVRVAAAGLNPVDWKLRSGALQAVMPLTFPAILGRDAAGEVVGLGAGVSELALGTRVLGLVLGAYAELVVAKVDAWAEIPPKMDLIDAAALPLALLTGAQLIEEAVRPNEGDAVLVTGALGSVGRVAVFAAKARGAKVWAGVRRAQLAEAKKLGVTAVVALDDAAAVGDLPRVDAIADTIGGDTLRQLLPKVKPGGIVGSVVGEPPAESSRGLVVRAMWAHPNAARLAALAQDVAEGRLLIPIARKFPLSEARAAMTLAEHHAGGKVLLITPRAG